MWKTDGQSSGCKDRDQWEKFWSDFCDYAKDFMGWDDRVLETLAEDHTVRLKAAWTVEVNRAAESKGEIAQKAIPLMIAVVVALVGLTGIEAGSTLAHGVGNLLLVGAGLIAAWAALSTIYFFDSKVLPKLCRASVLEAAAGIVEGEGLADELRS